MHSCIVHYIKVSYAECTLFSDAKTCTVKVPITWPVQQSHYPVLKMCWPWSFVSLVSFVLYGNCFTCTRFWNPYQDPAAVPLLGGDTVVGLSLDSLIQFCHFEICFTAHRPELRSISESFGLVRSSTWLSEVANVVMNSVLSLLCEINTLGEFSNTCDVGVSH